MVFCNFGNQYVFNNSNNMSRCIGLALPIGVNVNHQQQDKIVIMIVLLKITPFYDRLPTNNQLGVTFKDIINCNE